MSLQTTEKPTGRTTPRNRSPTEPDYEELRLILEQQFDRPVTTEEAVNTGKCLINVYEILLSDEATGDTMTVDTT